ncbi:MAG: type II secretion system protein GspM [bacterium]
MQAWYQGLSSREKYIVLYGGIILIAVLYWAFVWEPIAERHQQLAAQVQQKQEELIWMQQASLQALQLQALQQNGHQPQSAKSNENPQLVVDRLLKRFRLDQASPSLQPKGTQGIQLSLKLAPFDRFVRFLETLEQKHGLVIDHFSIRPAKEVGMANISVSLRR